MRQALLPCGIVALLAACSANAPTPGDTTSTSAATTPSSTPATPVQAPPASATVVPAPATTSPPATADTTPAFVGTPWRAGAGTGVEAGSTYTFERDGTLRMTSPHGTPSLGQWRYENGTLTMVEEGIAYPTDIVSQDATHLVLRSHNPGGAVEIALARHATAQPHQSHESH